MNYDPLDATLGALEAQVNNMVEITLRDYFAAMANEEDINKHQRPREATNFFSLTREEARYSYADAMIEAKWKKQDERQPT